MHEAIIDKCSYGVSMEQRNYLPGWVIIISVPISWKRFQRSAHCSSTWISSIEVGSQAAGARSVGEPKEQEVLSARPSPSEPGLASESVAMKTIMKILFQ